MSNLQSTPNPANRFSARTQVLEAICELYEQEQAVTSESIERATGLKRVTIADCLKFLKDRGDIYTLERGVYRPTIKHPPARPVSRTTLPDGTVKLEVGDEMLTLTPRESRMVAEAMGGSAAVLVAIESSNQVAEVLSLMRHIAASDLARVAQQRESAIPQKDARLVPVVCADREAGVGNVA